MKNLMIDITLAIAGSAAVVVVILVTVQALAS